VRIEVAAPPDARVLDAVRAALGDVPVEIEPVLPGDLLDVELLGRSPHVYKPVMLSDWTRPGRQILTVGEGMIEWPRPSAAEGKRWLGRTWRAARRRRRLVRGVAAVERDRTR
jgi:hypothetical protein